MTFPLVRSLSGRSLIGAVLAFALVLASLATLPAPARGADIGCGAAEIGGTVYRDYSSDGVLDSAEPGEAGIVVTAYDATGASVASTTTDGTGAWLLTVGDGAAVRVEVTGLAAHLQPGPNGPDSQTTVFMATQGTPASKALPLVKQARICELHNRFKVGTHVIKGIVF